MNAYLIISGLCNMYICMQLFVRLIVYKLFKICAHVYLFILIVPAARIKRNTCFMFTVVFIINLLKFYVLYVVNRTILTRDKDFG